MTLTSVRMSADATASSYVPASNYGGQSKVVVAYATRIAFLYGNQPMPNGVKVNSATLRLYQAVDALAGSRVVSVYRVVAGANAPWSESQITYNNMPLGTSPVSLTKTDDGVNGREWAFDITSAMQAIADGAPWYGLRVQTDLADRIRFHARESAGEYVPVLEVDWTDLPAAPTSLAPSDGRAVDTLRPTLRWLSDDAAVAYNVQLNSTDSFTSPAVDVTNSSVEGEYTLTADAGSGYYWRVRVQDGSGMWSNWSESEYWTQDDYATVTATTDATVYSSTPTLSHTISGQTQRAFQYFIVDPDNTATVLWDSGKTDGTATSMAIPPRDKFILQPGTTYRHVVRVWDELARESVPEGPVYVDDSTDFEYSTDGVVTPVSSLAAAPVTEGSPFLTVTFSRTVEPDSFAVLADGVVVAIEDDVAAFQLTSTTYSYELRGVRPRKDVTIGVSAGVGGAQSAIVSVATRTDPTGVWLFEEAAEGLVVVLYGDPDPHQMVRVDASEDTTIFTPTGARSPVMISQVVRQSPGALAGKVHPDDLADYRTLIAKRGTTLGLTVVDRTRRVQPYNTVEQHADEFDGYIPVAFDFIGVV